MADGINKEMIDLKPFISSKFINCDFFAAKMQGIKIKLCNFEGSSLNSADLEDAEPDALEPEGNGGDPGYQLQGAALQDQRKRLGQGFLST